MNKQELIDAVSEQTGASRSQTGKTLDAFLTVIRDTVAEGDFVQLIGFGSFSCSERAARRGRNPKTGETLEIAAARVVKFTAGKLLKEAVNQKRGKKK